jgi:hypothetical protein
MPRAPPRCGHCRELGHMQPRCRELEVDKILQMCGNIPEHHPEEIKVFDIKKRIIAEIQLLKEGIIPKVIYKTKKRVNVARRYEIVVIRCENTILKKETIMYSEDNWTTIKNSWDDYTESIKEHEELLNEKCDKYSQRLRWLDRDLPGLVHWSTGEIYPQIIFKTTYLHMLFHVDYVSVKDMLEAEQIRKNNVTRRIIEERNHARNVVAQVMREQDRWTNRESLPILRETVIETDDCPVCLDSLGETSKAILRCGHQICMTCMLTQTLRAATEKNAQLCHCPVCRTGYL